MTTKRALLLQFRDDISKEHEAKCFLQKSGLRSEQLVVLNAITDVIEENPKTLLNSIDAVFMGGSGQYDLTKKPPQITRAVKKTHALFDYIFENDFPTLAVCFGHQLIAQLHGGLVSASKVQAEVGDFKIKLTKDGIDDKLFANLPKSFNVQLGHKESISKLPDEFILLASSKKCTVQAYRYKNNIYGVQFHPELDKEDIAYRLGLYPTYAKNTNTDEIINNLQGTPIAKKVLQNFVKHYLQ